MHLSVRCDQALANDEITDNQSDIKDDSSFIDLFAGKNLFRWQISEILQLN